MKEIWKDIPGYESRYCISNKGRIVSLNYNHTGKPRKLVQSLATGGYPHVVLCNNGKKKNWLTHQLMAITFLNHKMNGHEFHVDHIDGNKLNNDLQNLRIVSARENTVKDLDQSKTKTGLVGSTHTRKGKYRARISINGKQKHIGYFTSAELAHKAYLEKLDEANKGYIH